MRKLLRRKQSEEALALHTNRLQALLDLHLLQQAPQEQILDFVLDAALKTMQSEYGFIGLMDEAESIMTIHRWSDKAMAQCAMIDKPILFPLTEAGLWGDCVRQRKAVLVNDYQAPHPGKKGLPAGHNPIRRFLAVPVLDGGRTVAVAAVANKGKDYSEDDVSACSSLFNKMWELLRRKQAEEVLRESEERHRTILQTALDGFWRADLQGRLLEVNEAYCRMSGYSEQELLAINIRDIEATETPADTDAHMQKIMAQGEDRFETRHRRKDGSIFEVEVSVQYKPTERGLLVAFLRDITERKRAEEDLRKRTAELEFANREMEAFSYSVSHDLKAPVRAIQGFSRMLMAEHADKLDAEALRLLQVITTNTKLMHHLIDDLLALSRLGRLQIRKSVINLTGITNKVFEKLRSQAPERDLQLTLGDLPPGLGDQSLLYQVMENLLANAVKFTKSRKTAVIEVGGRTEDKENIYYVKDNGAGFDERYVDKLFRPFQRLHGGEEYEGTGVGLAIVQRIIQRHGGRVWAEGKLGDGATFGFALPKKED